MEKEIEKSVELQSGKEAAGLTDKSPEPLFYFVFVCRGSRAAYRQIEEFLKAKTTARVIFQRISRNYLSVSEVQLKATQIKNATVNCNFKRVQK
ncbi:MAG: hypothetical protein QXL54_05150 [Candidatus Bathyarchaeia archaeon]